MIRCLRSPSGKGNCEGGWGHRNHTATHPPTLFPHFHCEQDSLQLAPRPSFICGKSVQLWPRERKGDLRIFSRNMMVAKELFWLSSKNMRFSAVNTLS